MKDLNCNTRGTLILIAWHLIYQLCNAATSPNVVIIVADDLGWDDVGFHGSSQIPTPNLDALASDGIILSNYYVQPICTPSRSSLLTGRHPIHLGLQHGVISSSQPYGLGLREKLLPQYMKELGYSTHMVGKWHLGFFAKEYTPLYRGFDSHFGYYQGCEDYWDHSYAANPRDLSWGLDFRRGEEVVKDAFGQYSTHLFTSETERIINEHNTSKPLLLYLPHQAVHSGNPVTPLEAPYEYYSKLGHIKDKNRRTFAAMVSVLDESVGNVTQALHAKGILNNTIIMFTTDNGGPPAGFDMNHASNSPLRGTKAALWEGGIRATGFLWSPLIRAPYVSSQLVHVSDWLPTLLSAAGYNMNTLPLNLDGIDQWSILSLNHDPIRTEILHNIDPVSGTQAVRVRDMKLIHGQYYGWGDTWNGWYQPEGFTGEPVNMMPKKTSSTFHFNQISKESDTNSAIFQSHIPKILKDIGRDLYTQNQPVIIKCGPRPANASLNCNLKVDYCLYNITADPCEYNNIAKQHPDIVATLKERLDVYAKGAVPVLNKNADPKGYPAYHNWTWVPWIDLANSDNTEF